MAFRRAQAGGSALWLISPLGGAEERLADLHTTGQMSWSSDGRWLAVGAAPSSVGDPRGIVLIPIDGGEPRWISRRAAPAADLDPSFSRDGRRLAFVTCKSAPWGCDVIVQQLDSGCAPSGVSRRITEQGLGIYGLAWSRDGESLLYSGSWSWDVDARLLRVGTGGSQQPERLDLAGSDVEAPAIAPAGDRLAFGRLTVNDDIWRYELGGVPEPFLRPSRLDGASQFSPTGDSIVFVSGRSGDVIDVWSAGADGSRPLQLTKGPACGKGSPRWSPDGRLIACDCLDREGRTKVYVVEAHGGRPKRLSSETDSDFNPNWSRDGKWIYFCSDRTGGHEVWRTSLERGTAEQVTDNGGYDASESADGRTLYCTKSTASSLYARSLDGGPERQVLEHVTSGAFVVFGDGIYYIGRRGADEQLPIQFHEFSSGASRLLAKVEGSILQHLSGSPDRRTLLSSLNPTRGSDLMLIENFR